MLLDVLRPTRTDPDALRAEVTRFELGEEGALDLTGADGSPLLGLTSGRAQARSARWGRTDLFPSVRRHVDWLTPITPSPTSRPTSAAGSRIRLGSAHARPP